MSLPSVIENIPTDCDYSLITTEEQLDELCVRMMNAELLAIDTETEGLEYKDLIVGICVSVGPTHGAYIPIRHEVVDGVRYPNQLDPSLVFAKLKPILEEKPLTGHNVKFDLKMFWKDGVNPNFTDDTQIQANLIGEYMGGERSLKALTKRHLDHEMAQLESLFPKPKRGRVDIKPKILSPEDIMLYGCEDADYSYRLYEFMKPRMLSRVNEIVYSLEMRLLSVVAEMEEQGVPIDMQFLEDGVKDTTEILTRFNEELHKELREQVGRDDIVVNFNSYPQLRTVLYEYLNLPVYGRTPKGEPATSGDILEKLAEESTFVKRLMTFRTMTKLRSFMEKMIKETQDDLRIRGQFNQVGTETGRFTSKDPNLQQIPRDQTFELWPADDDTLFTDPAFEGKVRTNEENLVEVDSPDSKRWETSSYLGKAESNGKEYGVVNGVPYEMRRYKTRKFICAHNGDYVIEADYSQIELRIMAGESHEPTLLDAYAKGDDVHARTAAVIFGVPFENVTYDQRTVGKTINFSLLYGAGPMKIAQSLNISVPEAKDMVSRYFQNLPNILTWINDSKQVARREKMSKTKLGRVRLFPNILSRDGMLRASSEREAVNHLIQGAAADVMKYALVRTRNRMKQYFGNRVRIICTVHDSLILEVDGSIPPEDVAAVLVDAMEGFSLSKSWPQLKADIGTGVSWGTSKGMSDIPTELPQPWPEDNQPRWQTPGIDREASMGLSANIEEVEASVTALAKRVEEKSSETVEEVVNELVEEVSEPTEGSLGKWILEIYHPLDARKANSIINYLKEKSSPSGYNLQLTFPDDIGTMVDKDLEGLFTISKDNETDFRVLVGNCLLKQNLDSLNPEDVFKNVQFGS